MDVLDSLVHHEELTEEQKERAEHIIEEVKEAARIWASDEELASKDEVEHHWAHYLK